MNRRGFLTGIAKCVAVGFGATAVAAKKELPGGNYRRLKRISDVRGPASMRCNLLPYDDRYIARVVNIMI